MRSRMFTNVSFPSSKNILFDTTNIKNLLFKHKYLINEWIGYNILISNFSMTCCFIA